MQSKAWNDRPVQNLLYNVILKTGRMYDIRKNATKTASIRLAQERDKIHLLGYYPYPRPRAKPQAVAALYSHSPYCKHHVMKLSPEEFEVKRISTHGQYLHTRNVRQTGQTRKPKPRQLIHSALQLKGAN
ncbi:hypothetical protein M758_2G111000, partial [Ceratodon purpureus]